MFFQKEGREGDQKKRVEKIKTNRQGQDKHTKLQHSQIKEKRKTM